MLSKLGRYWKAGAAFVGGLVGVWTYVAADESISFEEIGYVGVAVPALFAALVTALSPRNSEV